MSNLEKKVNALMRFVTAENPAEQEAARKEISSLTDAPPQKPVVHQPDLQARICAALTELGVPARLKGHRCLAKALEIAMNDPDILDQITKRLYVETGMACNMTPSKTERAIRHAIEVAWNRGDLDVIQKYFGNTVSPNKGKPTNSEFIAQVVNVLLLRQ